MGEMKTDVLFRSCKYVERQYRDSNVCVGGSDFRKVTTTQQQFCQFDQFVLAQQGNPATSDTQCHGEEEEWEDKHKANKHVPHDAKRPHCLRPQFQPLI